MSKTRKRTAGVNVRLTDYERKRIQSKSKKCGLSMSEYIRQTALGTVPKSILPEEIEEIKFKLIGMYNYMTKEKHLRESIIVIGCLDLIENLQNTESEVVDDGSNVNMGG